MDEVDWLSFTPASGSMNENMTTITVEPNTSIESRQAIIIIRDVLEILKTVVVHQNGATNLSVSTASLHFVGSGEQQSFAITSDASWRISSDDDATWLTFSPTDGTNNATIQVTAEANRTTFPRTATMYVTGQNDIRQTISVTQDAGADVLLSVPASVSLSGSGEQKTVTVTSNRQWGIAYISSWLTVDRDASDENGTITFTAAANTGPTPRTAVITVRSWEDYFYQTIVVRQETSANSGGQGLQQTWNLTPTMTATLDIGTGELTIQTTKEGEAIPSYISPPWSPVSSAITSVVIEPGVGGVSSFRRLENLTSVTLSNSVTSIEPGTFRECISLPSVTLPASVTLVGPNAFQDCSSLTSVTLPNSVTLIGDYAFQNCGSLVSITLPVSVTSIESCAFQNCTRLTSVTLPASVTSVEHFAFAGCCSLTSATLPNSVTGIGYGAFSDCTLLKDVTVSWIVPINMSGSSSNFFTNTANPSLNKPARATLHVPAGTENMYKIAPVWKDFIIGTYNVSNETIESRSLKAYTSDGILHVTGLQLGTSLRIYNLSGQLVYQNNATAEEEQILLHARGVYMVVAGTERAKVIL